MDLAKAIGHPRWAITAAIHDAMGATERAAHAKDNDVQFPSNDELLKMAEEKHRVIGVVREDKTEPAKRDVVAEQTVELRAEVKEAYAAWQGDVDNYELEEEYFDKLDRLDHNLSERGLERG